MKKIERIILVLVSILMAVIAIVGISHMDLNYISLWAISLLDHIKMGQLGSYANDLLSNNQGTNYNLFQNGSVAFWCLPLYVLNLLTKIKVSALAYQVWIKMIIAILQFACAKELYTIVMFLKHDERMAWILAILYLGSPVVLIHGIGIGQIDVLGVLFFLLSIRFCLEKKYYKMALAMGFALLSKFFVLMFYVPWLLLEFKNIKKYIKYIWITPVVVIVNSVITRFLIKDYGVQASSHNKIYFIPRLFMVEIRDASIVLMLIMVLCAMALAINKRNKTKSYHYLLFPCMVYYVFFLLVYWHPQWYMYVLPMLLLMGGGGHQEEEFAFYYIGNSLGFTLYSLAKFNTNEVNAMLVWNSLLGSRISGKHTYVSAWILERFSEYSTSIGYTIFMASFAILIGLFFVDARGGKGRQGEQEICLPIGFWGMIAFVPTVIYYVVIFYCYFA